MESRTNDENSARQFLLEIRALCIVPVLMPLDVSTTKKEEIKHAILSYFCGTSNFVGAALNVRIQFQFFFV